MLSPTAGEKEDFGEYLQLKNAASQKRCRESHRGHWNQGEKCKGGHAAKTVIDRQIWPRIHFSGDPL